jgi:hypothetical protein
MIPLRTMCRPQRSRATPPIKSRRTMLAIEPRVRTKILGVNRPAQQRIPPQHIWMTTAPRSAHPATSGPPVCLDQNTCIYEKNL